MSSHAGSPDDQPLYLICKSGTRSTKAIRKFADAGYDNTINVIGGTNAWHAAGLPIEQNKQVISLERQVRITAGIFTLLGILLANLIHPYCMVLTIFVGTGLVYAGITETAAWVCCLARCHGTMSRVVSVTHASRSANTRFAQHRTPLSKHFPKCTEMSVQMLLKYSYDTSSANTS